MRVRGRRERTAAIREDEEARRVARGTCGSRAKGCEREVKSEGAHGPAAGTRGCRQTNRIA